MLHVTARIRLLKTAEGGRASFVRSGYRPSFRFGDLYTDGTLTFLDRQQAYPSDECEVRLTLANPDYVRGPLVVGAHFDIMAGPRKVVEGTTVSIPTALQNQERPARRAPQPRTPSR